VFVATCCDAFLHYLSRSTRFDPHHSCQASNNHAQTRICPWFGWKSPSSLWMVSIVAHPIPVPVPDAGVRWEGHNRLLTSLAPRTIAVILVSIYLLAWCAVVRTSTLPPHHRVRILFCDSLSKRRYTPPMGWRLDSRWSELVDHMIAFYRIPQWKGWAPWLFWNWFRLGPEAAGGWAVEHLGSRRIPVCLRFAVHPDFHPYQKSRLHNIDMNPIISARIRYMTVWK